MAKGLDKRCSLPSVIEGELHNVPSVGNNLRPSTTCCEPNQPQTHERAGTCTWHVLFPCTA